MAGLFFLGVAPISSDARLEKRLATRCAIQGTSSPTRSYELVGVAAVSRPSLEAKIRNKKSPPPYGEGDLYISMVR